MRTVTVILLATFVAVATADESILQAARERFPAELQGLLDRPPAPVPQLVEPETSNMVVAPPPTGLSVARLRGFVLVIVRANGRGACYIENFGRVQTNVQILGSGTGSAVAGMLSSSGECEAGAVGFGIGFLLAESIARAQKVNDECNTSFDANGVSRSFVTGNGIFVQTTGDLSGSTGCDGQVETSVVAVGGEPNIATSPLTTDQQILGTPQSLTVPSPSQAIGSTDETVLGGLKKRLFA